jgi:hypothetical protein
MHLFARELEFTGQARGRFAFGDAAQQQHQRGGRLACFLEGSPAQQGVVAIAVATAVGWKVFLLAEQTPLSTHAMRTHEAVGMEMALQPEQANALVEQLGDWKVYSYCHDTTAHANYT